MHEVCASKRCQSTYRGAPDCRWARAESGPGPWGWARNGRSREGACHLAGRGPAHAAAWLVMTLKTCQEGPIRGRAGRRRSGGPVLTVERNLGYGYRRYEEIVSKVGMAGERVGWGRAPVVWVGEGERFLILEEPCTGVKSFALCGIGVLRKSKTMQHWSLILATLACA